MLHENDYINVPTASWCTMTVWKLEQTPLKTGTCMRALLRQTLEFCQKKNMMKQYVIWHKPELQCKCVVENHVLRLQHDVLSGVRYCFIFLMKRGVLFHLLLRTTSLKVARLPINHRDKWRGKLCMWKPKIANYFCAQDEMKLNTALPITLKAGKWATDTQLKTNLELFNLATNIHSGVPTSWFIHYNSQLCWVSQF